MAGKIQIDFERCKGCGLCVAVCPKGCIFISKRSNKSGIFPAETKNSDCTACCACAIVCPDAAITVFRDESTEEQRGKGKKAQRSTDEKTGKR